MEVVPIKIVQGEEKAWKTLSQLACEDVCRRASATHDHETGIYRIKSFGVDFSLSPQDKKLFTDAPEGDLFLGRLKDFFRLSLFWYLASSKEIPFTGRLIKPIDVKGGQRFFTGTHVLPLSQIAEKYAHDKEGFLKKGRGFGAEVLHYGDASLRIFPLPRVPVTFILWLEDEEFPPRADLLFDSSCELQISLSDIPWSIAMMASLVMLDG
ncbi:MAG: DUF3786 domain-containing protein [Thermodesulfovibrionales bacterium]|jgi:hypothetical protein